MTDTRTQTIESARADLSVAFDALTAAYGGNETAALASFLYAFDGRTRQHAVNSISASGNSITGPYDATIRFAGIEYRITKDASSGRVTVTREDVTITDIDGTVVETTTYTGERESTAKAYEVIALNAGRQARVIAENALVRHTPVEKTQRAAKITKIDAVAAQMAAMQEMLAALVKAQNGESS